MYEEGGLFCVFLSKSAFAQLKEERATKQSHDFLAKCLWLIATYHAPENTSGNLVFSFFVRGQISSVRKLSNFLFEPCATLPNCSFEGILCNLTSHRTFRGTSSTTLLVPSPKVQRLPYTRDSSRIVHIAHNYEFFHCSVLPVTRRSCDSGWHAPLTVECSLEVERVKFNQ